MSILNQIVLSNFSCPCLGFLKHFASFPYWQEAIFNSIILTGLYNYLQQDVSFHSASDPLNTSKDSDRPLSPHSLGTTLSYPQKPCYYLLHAIPPK
jgi:hypothetical protein